MSTTELQETHGSLGHYTRFMGQTSCIMLGFECQRVAYAQWKHLSSAKFTSAFEDLFSLLRHVTCMAKRWGSQRSTAVHETCG